MLFYYTATGNCLYVAKQIDENAKSIPQELKKPELNYQDDSIGIVAPIYAGELPKTVRKFIEKAHFDTDYFYLILTYGKNDSVASVWASDFCEQHGQHVDYVQTILMVDNYLPSFDMDEEVRLEKHENEQIQIAIENIKKHVQEIPQPSKEAQALYETVSHRFAKHPELNDGESIVMSSQCAGCKICEQVCPIGNIKVIDGKAKRLSSTCDFCLACVHNCPCKVIHLVKEKNREARYRNPHVSLKDIVKSNCQNS